MKTSPAYALLLALSLLVSCKKDADLIDCDSPAATNILTSIMTKNAVPVQTFTLSPGAAATLVTAAGYKITVPAGLIRADGRPLSASPVQVRVREVNKRSEMIFSRTPTRAARRLLESGGMFNIAFSQDNQPLQLAGTSTLQLTTTLPGSLSTSNGMQLFTALPDSLSPGQIGSWVPVSARDSTTRISSLMVGGTTGFQVVLSAALFNNNTRGLGWINCDRFINAAPVTGVQVSVTTPGATGANTQVFLVFNALNSMLALGTNGSTNGTFYAGSIPVGYSVTALVLHEAGGQLYFGKQVASVATNQVFTPVLRVVTEAELVAEIQAL